MFDIPARLVVAYGLIALIVVAGAAIALWCTYNRPGRREARVQDEYSRRRSEAAKAVPPER